MCSCRPAGGRSTPAPADELLVVASAASAATSTTTAVPAASPTTAPATAAAGGSTPEPGHVLRGRAFLALHDVELHALTFVQRLEAAALDRRMVDEQVLA